MASGAEGSRTLDLLNAIQALSQLSYGPTGGKTGGGVSIPRPSRVGQRDAASLPEVAARVDRRAVDAHLVVKVRPGGTARRADGADRLAAMHLLALAHVERGEMAVERVEPTAVIDDHEAAVARVAPAVEHRRHVDQWTRLRAALLHVRQAARLGAALAQRRRSAREAIDPARHLGHLPALAGDQLAPVREPRAEPRHLVAQRGAPLLGL